MNDKIKRRSFLKAAGIAGVGALSGDVSAEASPPTSVPSPSLPVVSNRVISHTTVDIEGGKEDRAVIEVIGANGVKEVSEFLRRAVGPNRTTTVRVQRFASQAETLPAYTTVHTILTELRPLPDGKVEVSVTVADENGIRPKRVMRVKPAEVDPYEGLSDQEIVDKSFSDRRLK
jgi:hypothetical protein